MKALNELSSSNKLTLVTCVVLICLSVVSLASGVLIHAFNKLEALEHRAVVNWVLNCVQIRERGIKEPLCDARDIATERAKIK